MSQLPRAVQLTRGGAATLILALSASVVFAGPTLASAAELVVGELMAEAYTVDGAALGAPVSSQATGPSGVVYQEFENGVIVAADADPATTNDTFAVTGALAATYDAHGRWDGRLGVPRARAGATKIGTRQVFSTGAIYHSAARGLSPDPVVITGALWTYYSTRGAHTSGWGYPAATEARTATRGFVRLAYGSYGPNEIYTSPAGTFRVSREMRTLLASRGGAAKMGYPVSEASRIMCGRVRQSFVNATLTWKDGRWCPKAGLKSAVTVPSVVKSVPYLDIRWSNVKVNMIRARLGLGWSTGIYGYDWVVKDKIKAVQRRAGLTVTGRTDAATWKALGMREPWSVDTNQTPVRLPITASRTQRIEQMIAFARSQVGARYQSGSSAGPYARGYSCSGLVTQAMMSAGLDAGPAYDRVKAAMPAVQGNYAIYQDPTLRRVPVSARQRGDLVFWYTSSSGPTVHVAIYLGNGLIAESLPATGVVVTSLRSTRGSMRLAPYAVRPFSEDVP